MKRSFKPLLVSLAALSATSALAEGDLFQKDSADWQEITGSIASSQQPFFQLAPMPSVADGAVVRLLQRLPIDARQLRFEGEIGRRDLPFYLRKEQVTEQAHLKIGYLNSIAVMPEVSRMKVLVNDQLIAEVVLDATTDAGKASVPIPPGLLTAGYNAISFHVQQRHRVDCSIEAANELWTQVDPAITGIEVGSTNPTVSQFEDLSALPVDADGATPITVVLPQSGDTTAVDRALRAVQALAIRIGVIKPRIAFTRDIPATPGIHLYVGTNTDLHARGIERAPFGDSAFTISGRLNESVKVAVGGTTLNDVDQNIFRLVVERPVSAETGTPAGLRAIAQMRGIRMTAEKEITFDSAGLASEEFNGRVYRASLNIVMPPDFYPADNGKAALYLDASYAAGLATTNEALVRVNGKVAGASRLRRSAGEDLTRRPVELSLKALQPGFNTVTLEIRTATEDDRDCNPLSLIEPKKRLTVLGSTAFALPPLSRIDHLPNLGATASTGYPFTEQKKPVAIYLPKPDFSALGAAATLLVRQAMAAGRPFDTRVSQKRPDETAGSALIVGALGDLPPDLVTYFGIKDDMLPENWRKGSNPAPANSAADASAPKASAPVQPATFRFGAAPTPEATPAVAAAEPEAKDPAPSIRWGKKTDERTLEERFRTGLTSFLSRNIGYTEDQLAFLNGDRSTVTATRTTKLVLAQQQSMAGGNASWMLVTGPEAATLARDTVGLISQTNWTQMSGQMVAYDPAEKELIHWPVGHHYHYSMRDWSFSNVALFTAGWLSNHIKYYILALLVACAIFGLFTRKLLNRIGAQP